LGTDEAQGYYQRVLAIEREMLGPDDLNVLILMRNLAGLERDRGRYAEAELLQRDLIARADRVLPASRPEHGLFLAGLAQTLEKEQRFTGAAEAFARARENLLVAYDPGHARVVKLDAMSAALYKEWGKPIPGDLP
jgi:Tetratricopeptide repeat